MSTIIESIEKEQLRSVPRFQAGDRVRVHFQVIEGSRTRTQVFEGVVIKRQGSGVRETFTVRKQSFGVGVERTFPLHSPKIQQLEVAARGEVRRAKLYYLRDRVGKAARVAERRWGITDDVLADEQGAVDSEGESQAEAEAAPTEEGAEDAEGAGEAPEGEIAEEAEEGVAEPEPVAAEPEPEGAEAEVAEAGFEEAQSAEAEAEEAESTQAEAEEAESTEAEAEEAESAPGAGGEADAEASDEEGQGDRAGGSEGDSTEDEASERDG